jgi:hypothetical protein
VKPACATVAVVLCMAVPVRALAQATQIPVGSRVGSTPASGYDDGNRPDPFLSLVVPKRPTAATPSGVLTRQAAGLVSLAIADVKVTGLAKKASRITAILEGPNRQSYVAAPGDRLADGVVKSIDVRGVVFVEKVTDATGAVEGHEIRKTLLSAAEVIR